MAESPMPYRTAIAFGDLRDAAREYCEKFQRAAVSFHHFARQLEALPPSERDRLSIDLRRSALKRAK